MDVKAYIASGIIESYVLGQASEQEQREIKCLSKIYPEIANYLNVVENDLEQFANAHAKTPPMHLKANILAAIAEVEQEPTEEIPALLKKVEAPKEEVKTEAKVIALNPMRKFYAAAAILIIAVLSGVLVSQINTTKNLQTQSEVLAAENAAKQEALDAASRELAVLTNPANTIIQLGGTEKYPAAKATVYWDKSSGNVYLQGSALAELPADEVYQLWVLVDGVPVDMGLFDHNETGALAKMKLATQGQVFAITIEKAGGSEAPTLEEMVVFGAVAG